MPRGLRADFAVADAVDLGQLDPSFDVVLDCALFRALDGAERLVYVQGLEAVTRPGAIVFVLCVGDAAGPHLVSRDELRAPFTGSGEWEIGAGGDEGGLTNEFGLASDRESEAGRIDAELDPSTGRPR